MEKKTVMGLLIIKSQKGVSSPKRCVIARLLYFDFCVRLCVLNRVGESFYSEKLNQNACEFQYRNVSAYVLFFWMRHLFSGSDTLFSAWGTPFIGRKFCCYLDMTWLVLEEFDSPPLPHDINNIKSKQKINTYST